MNQEDDKQKAPQMMMTYFNCAHNCSAYRQSSVFVPFIMKGLVGLHCTTAHQWGAILLPYQLLTRSSCPWCWKNGLNTYIYIFFSNYFALQIYLLCVLIKKKKMMNKKKTFINALGEILFFLFNLIICSRVLMSFKHIEYGYHFVSAPQLHLITFLVYF